MFLIQYSFYTFLKSYSKKAVFVSFANPPFVRERARKESGVPIERARSELGPLAGFGQISFVKIVVGRVDPNLLRILTNEDIFGGPDFGFPQQDAFLSVPERFLAALSALIYVVILIIFPVWLLAFNAIFL
tara:strand:- start:1300 stop:1692 length:393 start_codon:yes stop_codon:yes gene_type:complete